MYVALIWTSDESKHSPHPPIHDVVRIRDRTWTLITNALEFHMHVCVVRRRYGTNRLKIQMNSSLEYFSIYAYNTHIHNYCQNTKDSYSIYVCYNIEPII